MSVLKCDKKGSFKSFLSRNLYIILAFVIPAAIMGITFIIKRYFPFGDRMVMVTDCWHQYYPFLEEYQRMLKEGVSVFYSWNTGGGSNFLGVIANYLGSPLYLLSYFVPSGTPWLPVFFAMTIVVRIGLAGMFFAIFLRKVFKRNDISLVTFSLMYAFCAYIMGYYWNAMWLDTVALMPLVIAGVVGVLRDKEFSLYTISLAVSILCSFYIGYMVCLFVLLFSICYTVVSFVSIKESLKNAGKMLLYTVVAFMLTAFLTVPSFMALQGSDSAGLLASFPKKYEVNPGFDFADKNPLVYTFVALAQTVTNLLAYNHPIKMDVGAPNIACSVLCLVLLSTYLFTKKISVKEKIVSSLLCVFMLLSFVMNQLNYVWHGMAKPAMVYYRFSFIFSFILIVLAYRAYTFIDEINKKRFVLVCALLSLYLVAAFFLHRKISVAVTFVIAVMILLLIVLMKKEKISKNVFALLLCLVVVAESFLSAFVGASAVGNTKMADYPNGKTEVEKLKAMCLPEDEIYRAEFTEYHTLNDGDLHDLYGITTFNSMVNKTYTDFLTEFGIAGSVGNNRYAYFETTPVFNLFLNVKYLFARDGKEAVDTAFTDKIGDIGECTLYENNAYVPMGFMVSMDLLETELSVPWVIPFEVQNRFFTKATGIDKAVFESVEHTTFDCGEYADRISRMDGFRYYYRLNLEDVTKKGDEDVVIAMEYNIEADGAYYGLFRNTLVDEVYVVVNGDEENKRELDESYTCVYALGEFKKGDKVRIELPASSGKDSRMAAYMYRIDEEVFREGVRKLSENTMELTSKSQRGFEGKINVKEAGLFYTSVFYDEGFRAYVDGEEVKITPVAGTLIAFELSEGEHTIELKFTPKGLYPGIAISLAGLAAFVMIALLKKRRKVTVTSAENTPSSEENTEPDNIS